MRLIAVAFINYFVGENTSQSFGSLVSGIVVIKIAVDVFVSLDNGERLTDIVHGVQHDVVALIGYTEISSWFYNAIF